MSDHFRTPGARRTPSATAWTGRRCRRPRSSPTGAQSRAAERPQVEDSAALITQQSEAPKGGRP